MEKNDRWYYFGDDGAVWYHHDGHPDEEAVDLWMIRSLLRRSNYRDWTYIPSISLGKDVPGLTRRIEELARESNRFRVAYNQVCDKLAKMREAKEPANDPRLSEISVECSKHDGLSVEITAGGHWAVVETDVNGNREEIAIDAESGPDPVTAIKMLAVKSVDPVETLIAAAEAALNDGFDPDKLQAAVAAVKQSRAEAERR